MSGGVDSSVAAALLAAAGWRVIGFTLRLGGGEDWEASRACCGLSEVHEARRVADRLGIDHYVLDHSASFERHVVRDFLDQYAAGRTPNPCVRCNQHVKFSALLEQARAFDCVALATGHYARLGYDEATGRHTLARGADPAKDQSYVLWPLTQAQLAQTRLPLGELSKSETRAIARELGLSTADKPESQDICFVEGGYAAFVAARRPESARPGALVDAAGQAVGEHRGVAHYTVGQRRRLGLASAEPLYVSAIDAATNAVMVEPAEAAGRSRFSAGELNWVSAAPDDEWHEALVQVRYRMSPVTGRFRRVGPDAAAAELDRGLRGIAPGQSAVFYGADGRVLAGGTIESVVRDGEAAA